METLLMADLPGLQSSVYKSLSYRQRKAALGLGLALGSAIAVHEVRRGRKGETGSTSEEAARFVKVQAGCMAVGRWVVPALAKALVRP